MCSLEKNGGVYVLTLTGDSEHWLNLTILDTIGSILRKVRDEATRGSVLITTAQGRFFSNGFDLPWAKSGGPDFLNRLHLMVERFKQIAADLISLPMPTIAAVTGHAAAAGFLFALCHDYVFMRKDKGILYMSEIDLGLPIPEYFTVIMRSKINSPMVRRDILMKGKKIGATEAMERGIIDFATSDQSETMKSAVKLAEELNKKNWNGEVYADIRRATFRDVCPILGITEKLDMTKLPSKL